MARIKSHEEMKKITFNAPISLVESLLKDSDEGITEMLCRLMKDEKRRRAQKAFAALRGKIKFEQTYEEIKEARK